MFQFWEVKTLNTLNHNIKHCSCYSNNVAFAQESSGMA